MSLRSTVEKLRAEGVETVAVIGTAAERARRYFRYRPPRYPVAADPDLLTHRAFGVPRTGFGSDLAQAVTAKLEGLARESGIQAPPDGAWEALDRLDGIDRHEFTSDLERHQAQFIAQFAIDQAGIIRWSNVECERDGLEGLDRFPTDDELLAVARAL